MSKPIGQAVRPRHKFTLYRDLEIAPRKDWLIEGILGAGELSCLFGSPGSGKSIIVGDLVAHVAAGRDWFGRKVLGGSVLHVAVERASVVKRRYAAIRKHYELNDLPLAILEGDFDLRTKCSDADSIISHAHALRDKTGTNVRLIVIETINRIMAAGDENSSKDMGALIANVERIRAETGAHVLLIHHTPADGTKRLRGHSSLSGACDTTLSVTEIRRDRILKVEKANDAVDPARLEFQLTSVELSVDPNTGQVTTAPVVVPAVSLNKCTGSGLSKAAQKALEALRAVVAAHGKPPPPPCDIPLDTRVITLSEWRDHAYKLGISSGGPRAKQIAFGRAIDRLLSAGRISMEAGYVWLNE